LTIELMTETREAECVEYEMCFAFEILLLLALFATNH
jgi:hypothetical protein